MASTPQLVKAMLAADARYQRALTDAEKRKAARDTAVLAAAEQGGLTVRAIAAHLGVSAGRVQQILNRAREQH